MVKYKLLNHVHEWKGDCFLSDVPSDGYMPTIKNESQAKSFYKENEPTVEKIIVLWGLEFEKVGESEELPKAKPKPVERKTERKRRENK